MTSQPQSVKMQPIIKRALNRLQPIISEYNVEIILPKSWPQALGHGPWIEAIWASYLTHAILLGGAPPRIELGADLLPGGQIRFWVRNNGDSITPERLAHIFEAPSEHPHAEQVISLPIVKRLITQLGGDVDLQSAGTASAGSLLSFTLPAAVHAVAPNAARPA